MESPKWNDTNKYGICKHCSRKTIYAICLKCGEFDPPLEQQCEEHSWDCMSICRNCGLMCRNHQWVEDKCSVCKLPNKGDNMTCKKCGNTFTKKQVHFDGQTLPCPICKEEL